VKLTLNGAVTVDPFAGELTLMVPAAARTLTSERNARTRIIGFVVNTLCPPLSVASVEADEMCDWLVGEDSVRALRTNSCERTK